jgi:hypothetical protein
VASINEDAPPAKRLEQLAQEAVSVARKARKHRQSLTGQGFYAKKLAQLRIGATNAFAALKGTTAGDASALAELVASVFAPGTQSRLRTDSERELTFALRTTWRDSGSEKIIQVDDGIFPLALLERTKRGYIIMIGRQINGCFQYGFYDACAVMMRRLLEVSIIEAFEAKQAATSIQDQNGNYVQLSDLVTAALSESSLQLSRNAKRALPKLRDNGHLSAHGRSYFAQRSDVERLQPDFRVAVEELLHVSNLL